MHILYLSVTYLRDIMYNTFSIIFFLQRNKATNDGKAPIYLRITVNGRRSLISVNRKILMDQWNNEAGKVNGTTPEIRDLNRYMDSIRYKIYKIQLKLQENNRGITSQLIKDIYLGKEEDQKMLLKIFQDHNDQVERLVGEDFAAGTLERYKTAKMHVENFIIKEYKSNDIPVKDVDHKFISGFEYYLKTERKCGHNTAVKYITNFKKIIRIAFANDWITKDPFFHWKAKLKIVDREFLTEGEIQKMVERRFITERLDQVKDVFVFCCFTGLAYADVKKLSPADIVIGIDGEQWINIKRTKTDTRSNIPILPTAQSIIEKYQDHPDVVNGKVLLPVLSNQKTNAYLKEIGDICGIDKNLTFHLARHTFATTVTLTNGVPIESVSKMLGHKSLKTTQHYAKILDRKVSNDMQKLRSFYNEKEENKKKKAN